MGWDGQTHVDCRLGDVPRYRVGLCDDLGMGLAFVHAELDLRTRGR